MRLSLLPTDLLISQLHDILHKVRRLMPGLTIRPHTPIPNTPNLPIQPNSTALGNIRPRRVPHTSPQQLHTVLAIIAAGAIVQLLEADAVLERAVVHEVVAGDVLVVARQAHGEAEVGLGVGVEVCGAEFEDVAEAF